MQTFCTFPLTPSPHLGLLSFLTSTHVQHHGGVPCLANPVSPGKLDGRETGLATQGLGVQGQQPLYPTSSFLKPHYHSYRQSTLLPIPATSADLL